MNKLLSSNCQAVLNKFYINLNTINNILYKHYILCNKIAICVSGGIDSTALLILINLFKSHNLFKYKSLYIICVNHGTIEDQYIRHYVQNIIYKLKIKCHFIYLLAKNDQQINKEKFLRNIRYNAIESFCMENNISCILLGHNSNEQYETIVMRIIKGSSIFGLAGIKEIETTNSGLFKIRPLLNISKSELKSVVLHYLNKDDILHDKSNNNLNIERIFIRHYMSKINNIAMQHNCMHVSLESRQIQQFILNNCKHHIMFMDSSIIKINIHLFMNLDYFIQYFLIKSYINLMQNSTYYLRRRTFAEIRKFIKSPRVKSTFCNCIFTKNNNSLLITMNIDKEYKRLYLNPFSVFTIHWNKLYVINFYNKGKKDITILIYYENKYNIYPKIKILGYNVTYTIILLLKQTFL